MTFGKYKHQDMSALGTQEKPKFEKFKYMYCNYLH